MTQNKVIVTLKNRLKVGNFSSPHLFKFDDESILPAVSDSEAQRLKIEFIEDVVHSKRHDRTHEVVELRFELADEVEQEICEWVELHDEGKVDVVIIPLPMLTAMKGIAKESIYKWTRYGLINSPFRCIRIEDRTNKLVSSSKFCI